MVLERTLLTHQRRLSKVPLVVLQYSSLNLNYPSDLFFNFLLIFSFSHSQLKTLEKSHSTSNPGRRFKTRSSRGYHTPWGAVWRAEPSGTFSLLTRPAWWWFFGLIWSPLKWRSPLASGTLFRHRRPFSRWHYIVVGYLPLLHFFVPCIELGTVYTSHPKPQDPIPHHDYDYDGLLNLFIY